MQHIFNIKSPIRKSDSGAERKKKGKREGEETGNEKNYENSYRSGVR